MERRIPKNVRQIGNVSDSPKIYVEDYVDTFFMQLCEKTKEAPVGAFLIGEMQKTGDEDYVYIYGAIQMHELKVSEDQFVIDDDAWKKGFEECKQFFEDGEMLGWFVVREGSPILPDAQTVKLHKKSFPGKNTVFITKDALEKDEIYYVQKFNDLMEIGGHYIYYEKNPSMQNYMIASRKENGCFPSETVEDRAAKDFRTIVKDRTMKKKRKKLRPLGFAAGLSFVVAVALLLVTTLNNMRKMHSVQTALDEIAKKERDNSGFVEANVDLSKENEINSHLNLPPGPDESETEQTPVTGTTSGGEEDPEKNSEGKIEEPPGTSGEENPEPAENVPSENENESGNVYIVEEGDTLAGISKKIYDDYEHVEAICMVNGLVNENLIYVGQKLVLP